MKLRYLPHRKINRQQWDDCIRASEHPLPYALSWYLDASTDKQWDAIVADDYDQVMPLPYNRKVPFFPQVYQPILSQQLGIFGSGEVSLSMMQAFLEAIPAFFKPRALPFHSGNPDLSATNTAFVRRTNLMLNLDQDYNDIKAGYSHGLRQRLKKAKSLLSITESDDTKAFFQFCTATLGDKLPYNAGELQKLRSLLLAIKAEQCGRIYIVTDRSGNICTMGLFLVFSGRIINLMNASNAEGRKLAALHFLFDNMIRKYSRKAAVFDFEGSEIPGVKAFFESFGAHNIPYTFYRSGSLPLVVELLKKWSKRTKGLNITSPKQTYPEL